MEIKKINIATDLDGIESKEDGWSDVFITLDDDRTYIVQVVTYAYFLTSDYFLVSDDEAKNIVNFLPPRSPVILVKELTEEIIKAAIHYFVKEREGYWIKFYHLGTEIDDKTLNVLTDRWFAKQEWITEVYENDIEVNPLKGSLIDFTVSQDSDSKIELENFATIKFKAKLKAELRVELQQEFEK